MELTKWYTEYKHPFGITCMTYEIAFVKHKGIIREIRRYSNDNIVVSGDFADTVSFNNLSDALETFKKFADAKITKGYIDIRKIGGVPV